MNWFQAFAFSKMVNFAPLRDGPGHRRQRRGEEGRGEGGEEEGGGEEAARGGGEGEESTFGCRKQEPQEGARVHPGGGLYNLNLVDP
jgi:hypothetical protein